MAPSFKDRIITVVDNLFTVNYPDKRHPEGRYLGRLFIIQTVRKWVNDKWKEESKNFECDTDKPGDYVLSESPKFVLTAKVAKPAKVLDEDKLWKFLMRLPAKRVAEWESEDAEIRNDIINAVINELKTEKSPAVTKTISIR